ncbi:MAG: integron integrase [Pseudomonadales bacterium]|nr:integron integrase [Pseudomonadales bacterium]
MDDIPLAIPSTSNKFIPQLRRFIRERNYAYATEKTYIKWILQFIRFHNLRHPEEMGPAEVEQFLSYLAVERNVSKSTQSIALNALVFLNREFLKRDDMVGLDFRLTSKATNVPVVFSHQEALKVIEALRDPYKLMAEIMYGAGLRVMESVRLRVKDIDFGMNQIIVRDGKGGKDRITMLPQKLTTRLRLQIQRVEKILELDRLDNIGPVWMPNALARKYPTEARRLSWQFIFPSVKTAIDPRENIERRHHLHKSVVTKHVTAAVRRVKIQKQGSSHTFRHSFATRLLEKGYDIRTIQALLGHNDVKTTERYTHVLNKGYLGVLSPID